ncbi:uncharacterized protein BDZ99DRAFT_140592 [Mytilinidion resinicola]|uniref:Uncharacterized protein n=1 Tax=Mytilinidion resinicola TaxID=574789 RepID=A0A6A6Z6I1_9PEZI|nr:uncharacterized protein BDZ99DRAFT_140592 [Mytilinidion resinicola]KAF2816640.1 hypothetical protein BDZ99DRAFT_140592 [Mytilinidion resinicola]
MVLGDKRNTSRKAQLFWSFVALVLAIFCLAWYRSAQHGPHTVISSAKPYLDLARAGWAIAIACALCTVVSVLYLPFATSDYYYLALSLSWSIACTFMVVGEVRLVQKNASCPAFQHCVGLDEPGMICSYVASVACFTQFVLLGAAFFQVKAFRKDMRRDARRSNLSAKPSEYIPKSRLGIFNPSRLRDWWSAGIRVKPMEVFADRP